MFKEERRIWIYLVGIAIFFGIIILFGRDVVLPIFQGRRNTQITAIRVSKPDFTLIENRDYKAKIETNLGEITIDLYENNAPSNVNNFIYLSNNDYYDGTLFHRLFPDFLIQGGDRNTLGTDKSTYGKGRPNYFIEDEINWDSLDLNQETRDRLISLGYSTNDKVKSIPFKQYSVAIANNGSGTNSSQFFIVIAESSDPRINSLNGYFTNIGEVLEGFEVIESIKKIEVDTSNPNVPMPKSEIRVNNIAIFF